MDIKHVGQRQQLGGDWNTKREEKNKNSDITNDLHRAELKVSQSTVLKRLDEQKHGAML